MALEDDLRVTINEVRADYQQQATDRETFQRGWHDLRMKVILPAFRRAIAVFREFGWYGEQEASNGSATLRLGEVKMTTRGHEPTWLYSMVLTPILEGQRVEIRTAQRREPTHKKLDELTPAAVDQIITEFARLSEEDFQRKRLPH